MALSTLLGLLIVIGSITYLYDSIQIPKSTDTQMVIDQDTLKISDRLKEVPKLMSDRAAMVGPQKMEKVYYLNIFPATLTWMIFHTFALSLGAASMVFLIHLIRNLRRRFEIRLRSKQTLKVLLPFILVVVITLLFYLLMTSSPVVESYSGSNILVSGSEIMDHFNIIFKDPQQTIKNVVTAFFLLGLVPLLGITMVNIAINTLWSKDPKEEVDHTADYFILKDRLNVFALVSGLLVAVSVIGTGLQRSMIAEYLVGDINLIYPNEFIYAYGLSFTLLLALFFLPSLAFLKYYKRQFKVKSSEETTKIGLWSVGKESIDDIKLIFSIVLPLLSSVVQPFLS